MAAVNLKRKLARQNTLQLHYTIFPFYRHFRVNQISPKSQFRNQSTCNPSITNLSHSRTVAPHSSDSTSFNKESVHHAVQTVFKTALNDDLIPSYLHDTYWWAYTHPKAVQFWERQWLVDAILWGNFNILKDEAIEELHCLADGHEKGLNVTQVAAVYGNFSSDLLAEMMSMEMDHDAECEYNIVDIAPIQLINTKRKVDSFLNQSADRKLKHYPMTGINVGFYQNDSTNLECFASESQDICYLFFLLHEQPKAVRLKTIREAVRIIGEKGKLVIVDYHKPSSKLNPFRYIMLPVLTKLEPFAIDLWNESVEDYISNLGMDLNVEKKLYFGGLYQKIVVTKQ